MPGPRVFTVSAADALVPAITAAFDEIDLLRERLRELKIKLNALEMIWGPAVQERSCPDHDEARALITQLGEAEAAITTVVQGLAERGVVIKDVHAGLADVYHVRKGILVQLCWKRGESAFGAWHHVDEGFAGRQPL